MKTLGCFGLLAVLAVLVAEGYSFVVGSRLLIHFDRADFPSWDATVLPLILIQGALMAVGVMAVKRAVNRLPTAMLGAMTGQSADAGRLVMQVIGGLLLIVPGFFLDVLGILLLLPPIQAVFAKLGQRVMMGIMRQQMAKMFPGGMPPGAFGKGFPGGPFPGMSPRGPLTPDERMPRRPKVIDTTAERVDGK